MQQVLDVRNAEKSTKPQATQKNVSDLQEEAIFS